jgi:hypothetical protein
MTPKRADVVFDNAKDRPVTGIRSLDTDGRQLVYRHHAFQVELLLQRSRSGSVVWGRMLRTDTGLPCEGAKVTRLERAKTAAAETLTDVWGEFWLPAAGEPTIELQVGSEVGEFVCTLDEAGA